MGVEGFYKWVERKGYEPTQVILHSSNSFVVDAKLIMYKKFAGIPSTCENIAEEIANGIFQMFRDFENVVFVNDGVKTIPRLKKFTLAKRKVNNLKRKQEYEVVKTQIQDERNKRIKLVETETNQEKKENLIVQDDVCFVAEEERLEKKARLARGGVSTKLSMDVLEILGTKYKTVQCNGEADAVLVKMAKDFDYVVSEDSDLLVSGIDNLLRFMGSKNLVYSITDILHKAECFNVTKRSKYPNPKITLHKLQEMVCIAGCDYTQGLEDIGLARAEIHICKYGSVANMVKDKDFKLKFDLEPEFEDIVQLAICHLNGKDIETHSLICFEPWFSFIENGTKTVEGRCGKEYENFKFGDKIIFNNEENTTERYIRKIVRYPDFATMLDCEGLGNCLPGIESMEKAIEIYTSIYGETEPIFAFRLDL